MRTEKGFSLIELLIVVGIILIIVAIAVPNLLRSKMAANESSAVASARTIGAANANYSTAFRQGFAGSLAQLGPTSASCATVSSACADLIDSLLSGISQASAIPVKSGYVFTYLAPNATPTAATSNNTFSVVATPVLPGSSGVSTFCLDQTNVIKKNATGAATTGANTGCSAFSGTPI